MRRLSCDQLWREEGPRFNHATAEEGLAAVSLIRAVGVVFSESGTDEQKDKVRPWLRSLLNDPQEKIRRYAMTALPKVGVGAREEAELLSLLRTTTVEREKKHLGETLQKVGGTATLNELGEEAPEFLRQTEQKIKASVARSQAPRALNLNCSSGGWRGHGGAVSKTDARSALLLSSGGYPRRLASASGLAACLARLCGSLENATVWDPFCGSGLELIERALLGGVRTLQGTDLSAEALAVSQRNLDEAKAPPIKANFTQCDFRDFADVRGLGPNTVDVIITNPPMGKRVPLPNLRGLIEDLFSAAATALRPGGKLVFANPLTMENPHPALKRELRQLVDFGGFDCRLEVYVKKETTSGARRNVPSQGRAPGNFGERRKPRA